ncbi:MAG: ABC transporter ATP-binding protein [Spirochaetes bacterium]|nr:ABC transporter ATP-binding protein [Spirochaetota bacterium]
MPENRFEEEEFTTQFNGKTVLRILKQLKPYWKKVTIFVVTIAVVAFLDSYFTYLSKRIVDEGIIPKNINAVFHVVKIYGSLMVVQAAAVLGMIVITGILGEQIHYDLRKVMFVNLQDQSLSYFDKTPVGWIMSRFTSDSERIADLVTWGLLDVSWAVFNISVALLFMLKINWKLALVVIAIVPILIIVAIQFKKKIILEYRSVRKINSRITGAYNENITGVRVVKALRREETNLRKFGTLTGEMYQASYRAAWLSALFLPAVQLLSAFALAAIIWIGGIEVTLKAMTIGGIQAFFSYVTFMLWPIQDLARVYANMQQSIASAERVFSLIDSVPEINDKQDAVSVQSIRGDIVFKDVNFYYEPDNPVLNNFNLTVRQGETIALVGPTGGGKSTIVNLLCRFYEPKGGKITIGSRDYLELTLNSIHSRLGIVLQTPHLFSGTIKENIRYGKLDASDKEVELAAEVSGAHEFIMRLDKGYEENVGESGNLLSVGQKQLISLARAVLVQPDIFIMDEATSSVDTISETLIQQGIEKLMNKCTSFIIAHRLSTIKKADRILVIRNGVITETGTHTELIKQKGHYYELYTNQLRSQLEKEFDPVTQPLL